MDKTTLGDRMKNNYENVNRFYLTRRMPIVIRTDMKAGHTFTKCKCQHQNVEKFQHENA